MLFIEYSYPFTADKMRFPDKLVPPIVIVCEVEAEPEHAEKLERFADAVTV
jgi:hypothetical protein